MYYNTTKEKGEILKNAVSKAQKQDDIILEFFKECKDKQFTASEIWINCFDTVSVPITSIRRSLNTLYKYDEIDNTGLKKKGIYGRNEIIWKIN
jgi:hypothetical protein